MTIIKLCRFPAVLGLGLAALVGPPSGLSPVLGVGPADAKAFYTRKRVNGAWVQGRFPKGASSRVRSRPGRAVAAVVVPASPLPPRPERGVREEQAVTASLGADHMSKLQSALQAKAQAIAAAPVEPTMRPVAPPVPASPRSVTFDFESGLKTTHFGGGVVVREPFDAATIRPLASPPPAPALSAGLPGGPDRKAPDVRGPDGKSLDRLPGS